MLSVWQAIILGAVQGVTEFLPISSSAHLVLIPWFLDWDYQGLAFDVALHFGTLLAVLAFFWREWLELLSGFLSWLAGKRKWAENREAKLFVFLAAATVPGALAGWLIAVTLFIFALVLWQADRKGRNEIHTREVSFWQSFFIGCFQALAILPGVSRSGATITAGLFLGLRKESAAKFSFLLATPIIFGAALVKAPEFLAAGFNWPLLAGILSAAGAGFLAIWFLMKLVQKRSYSVFVWYRIVLAAVILLLWWRG